ncbi:postacrosomal sheath WW domain-binding protein-like [Dermacentor silvarum]|uniref:postacrosomal sheath WW domain-binding protein-like n=1 Tax=Dermacentor silvarum TaxID=543639 RepID=UPI002101B177|nr:postacrosomal sheath WW domain-binding protein-like [Dermacentor silvarum]
MDQARSTCNGGTSQPPKRRKRYLEPGETYSLPRTSLRYQERVQDSQSSLQTPQQQSLRSSGAGSANAGVCNNYLSCEISDNDDFDASDQNLYHAESDEGDSNKQYDSESSSAEDCSGAEECEGSSLVPVVSILLYCDGVELTFEGPDAHQFHGTKKGRIYLTTHRMVFTNGNSKDFLQSFSFPFFTVSNLGLEQPIFGANYIKGTVKAEQNGNWTGKCAFKLKFMKGGAIEFGQAMMEAGKIASQHAAGMAPPPYFPPPGPYYCPPPPAYTPGQGVDYGFNVPYNVFPDAPPGKLV